MKPPSSDAEALRPQQPAPVCTPNGFFVATDEPRHFAGGQQPIGQALRVSGAVASELIVDPNGFRIRVQIPHGLLRGSTPIGIGRQRRRDDAQRIGAPHHGGDDADVVGETSREAPRGVKDLRSITDPAAGSGARRAWGSEIADAISGLSR